MFRQFQKSQLYVRYNQYILFQNFTKLNPVLTGSISDIHRLTENNLYRLKMLKHQKSIAQALRNKNFEIKLKDDSVTEEDILTIHRITNGGAMKWLKVFMKSFGKIPKLEISFNNLILLQKTPEKFLGMFLKKEFVEANLELMTGSIQTLGLYDCGKKYLDLKVSSFKLFISIMLSVTK